MRQATNHRERTIRSLPWLVALATLLLLVGCQGAGDGGDGDGAEAPAERVENATLGVAIANLPTVFQVVVNEGEQLELTPTDAALGGRLMVVAGDPPEVGGVNLVATVQAHKEEILARPDGDYKGQRELAGLPMGTSFYSRGRYTAEDGSTEEETVVYFLHPRGDRPLMLIYRYPAGEDSPSRLQDQLFEIALELEPMDSPTADDPAAEGDAGAEAGPVSEGS